MMRRLFGLLVFGLLASGGAHTAQAAFTPVYSNTTNFSGFGYANGGAAVVAGSDTTTTVYDDVTTAAGSGGKVVTGLSFSTVNFNAAIVSTSVRLDFFAPAAAGGPGTLIGSITFNPISLAAGSVQIFNFFPGTPLFTIPAAGTFYVGETFTDFGGTTGATAAQLNNLGEGIFSPPTVGSSADSFYQSTAPVGTPASNPTTGGPSFFGGNPAANFGFEFDVNVVPEPSSLIMSGMGLVALVGAGLSRRRRAASETIAA